MPELDTLRVIWWLLLGVLFTGFAVTDGFDLGVQILLPLISGKEAEKKAILRTIEPVWEGNQVWIILAAGAIFAAWPYVYAVVFSGEYFLVLLLLLTMGICRPVSIKYRNKVENPRWKRCWDIILFIGGFCPALIFGLLVGNLLLGLPFHLDDTMRIVYEGSLLDLFSPFALWCGLTSVFMVMMHGGFYLGVKLEKPLSTRALSFAKLSVLLLLTGFTVGGVWVSQLMGYQVSGEIEAQGYSNPLHKQVLTTMGAWLFNYAHYPAALAAPVTGFLGAAFAAVMSGWANRVAFFCSGLSIVGIIATVGVSMFPFIVPSSTQLGPSLLVWDASSSYLTLFIMLFVAAIFVPIILLYTTWVYRVLRGKVKVEYKE